MPTVRALYELINPCRLRAAERAALCVAFESECFVAAIAVCCCSGFYLCVCHFACSFCLSLISCTYRYSIHDFPSGVNTQTTLPTLNILVGMKRPRLFAGAEAIGRSRTLSVYHDSPPPVKGISLPLRLSLKAEPHTAHVTSPGEFAKASFGKCLPHSLLDSKGASFRI